MIKKIGNKWRVVSHTTRRNMGTYKTKKEAEKRLRQIKMFGEMAKRRKKK